MPDPRLQAALDRIERALARIEDAAARLPETQRADGELKRLREVHETLRARVEGAIAEIDQILETAEQG
jgi:hypothetical protein